MKRGLLVIAIWVMMTAGCGSLALASEYEENSVIYPDSAAASSTLIEAGYDHSIQNLFDGDLSTAWVEGADGNGSGEYVEIHIPSGTVIKGGVLYTGYLKTEDLFYKNSAPAVLEMTASGVTKTIDLSGISDSYYDALEGYSFSFEEGLVSDGTVYLTIKETRSGWKYTDTCISELVLYEGTAQPAESELISENEKSALVSLAQWTYEKHINFDSLTETSVVSSDLTSQDKAMGLYWYQYNCSDARILGAGEYNIALRSDLKKMMSELYGSSSEEDMAVFISDYSISAEDEMVYMNSTGDFGALGSFYFDQSSEIRILDGRLRLTGDVLSYTGSDYTPTHKYEIYYLINDQGMFGQYSFESVKIMSGTDL